MKVDYAFNGDAIRASLQRLQKLGADMTPITRAIAAELESESEKAFLTEQDPSQGKPWAPLKDSYKAQLVRKGYTGKMLNRTMGGLASSLSTDFNAVSAAIGTNKVYGAIQFFGGQPDMPAAPAAIVARPYMGLSPDGIENIIEIINITLASEIKSKA